MSSQGLNASNFPVVSSGPPVVKNILKSPYQFPPRDASDITRITKERLIYNENRPTVNGTPNTVKPGNPLPVWIKGGNQYRLSYLFGKVECNIDCQSLTKTGWGYKPVLGS